MRFLFLQISLSLSLVSLSYALKVEPPIVGAYISAFADFGAGADDVTIKAINDYESLSGRGIAWAYFANNWDHGIKFPEKNFAACKEKNVIPYVRLMPWSKQVSRVRAADPIYKMDSFIKGQFDNELSEYALKVKAFQSPVMIEFGPEANGDWFPWNGRWAGAGKKDHYGDPKWPDGPEKFKDAYIHLIKLFKSLGVQNVTWILHLDTSGFPRSWWNKMKYYYPGDEYIDWIGLSVFGSQLPEDDWTLFSDKLFSDFNEVQEVSRSKPILIAEFAVIENSEDANLKAQWLRDAFEFVKLGTLPQVKGLSYWHSKGWLEDGSANFRIDSSINTLNEFTSQVADPFWFSQPVLKVSNY